MKALFLLLILFAAGSLHAQTQTQCDLRWMFQYDPAAQVNAEASVNNDSTTSFLIALSLPASTISPSVGWTVPDADSFGVYLRTDSGVFITIQHDGPSNTFIYDTTFAGPLSWHEVVIHVTPGQHNYSIMLYPIALTGPLRPTVFNVPVYFGAAWEWNRAPGIPASVSNYSNFSNSSKPRWYDEIGREVDSTTRGFVISNDGQRRINP